MEALPECGVGGSKMQAPGLKIWGALCGASTTQASLCSCISSPLSSPAQPLRIRHPAVNAVNAAAPPQGSPLSTHHQPHHVSCFLHMGCHTFAEQRVCASLLPLLSSCLDHGTLGSHPSDHLATTMRSHWRPIFSLASPAHRHRDPGFCLFSAPSAELNRYSCPPQP